MHKAPLGVLIIHGFTSSLDCVKDIRPPIERLGLPTRMPVLRGHGAPTPDALRGVTWSDWVADGETALQDLLREAERVTIVGHSMGALVTIFLTADHLDVVDSIVLAAPAIQLTSPMAPGRPLAFLAPVLTRVLKKWDLPPSYADPSLAAYDTNYPWAPMDAIRELLTFSRLARQRLPEIRVPTLILQGRNDKTVAPESAEIVYADIHTPPENKRIIWFERTDHEMFRDCERESTIQAVVDYVKKRARLARPAADFREGVYSIQEAL